jgi:acetate kinase
VRVLTVNAGSSSLKLRLLGPDDELIADVEHPAAGGAVDPSELGRALHEMPAAEAVGHRIVHGAERFHDAVRVNAEVEQALRELGDLAPLHQLKSLAALDAVSSALPELPAVACFDTAFHATLPAAAATYALPSEWRERFGLRRYGFHGLSHAYAARRSAELLGRLPERLVVCHLGAGASLAAIARGRSVDTTMGFTPLEGMVMATRSGSVDPGMLLWLLERDAMSEREMAEALEHRSGLSGLAGIADMRELLGRAAAGEADASLARDVYVHRLRALIAAMAASLGGLDALVFTGGVGENAPEVRALALERLTFLSVKLDPGANRGAEPDASIAVAGSSVDILVIRSREDLEIASQVRRVLRTA